VRSLHRSAGIRSGDCRSRQIECEDAPLAGEVADANLTPVRLGSLETDGEPETESAAVSVSLLERTKQLLRLARREAAALVLDLEEDAVCGSARRQGDLAMGASELERVLEKIGDCRGEDLPIGFHRHRPIDGCDGESKIALPGLDRGVDLDLFEELCDRYALEILDPGAPMSHG
jgi:hypothetical protein